MKVTLEIQDNILGALIERSSATGVSTEDMLNSLLAKALEQPVHESVDLDLAIDSALVGVRMVPFGTTFLVEDIMPTGLWQTMSPGDRKSFGKNFRKRVEEAKLAVWDSRTSGNKAVYRRPQA
ncbi:DUF1413 domain-containing protein [Pseudomonas sp. SDI]|uniref:DUF1413 domain-containing protein n=1 Tax=Pseudomonas sp. SDI TaxID=2170734 RepID=UPI0014023F9A|nr:DUF1413 domain-containing protein [Pseudomonas sp. SDI]